MWDFKGICLFLTIPEEQPLEWKHAGLDQLREPLGCFKNKLEVVVAVEYHKLSQHIH